MKRTSRIWILFLGFILTLAVAAPIKAFTNADLTGDYILYEVDLSPVDLLFGEQSGYDTVTFPQDVFMREPGKPRLPFRVLHFALDDGKIVDKVLVSFENTEEIPGEYEIYPAQKSQRISDAPTFTEPDPVAYSSPDPFPDKRWELVSQGNLSGTKIATVQVYPLDYIPAQKKLLLHKKVKVAVFQKAPVSTKSLITTSASQSLSSKAAAKNLLNKLVVNPQDLEAIQELPPTKSLIDGVEPVDYLIITSQEFKDSGALLPLIADKEFRGLSVEVSAIEDIRQAYPGRDDPEKMRSFIKERHVNNGTVWVLLAGDTNIIPTRMVVPYDLDHIPEGENPDPTPCDMYFSDLDGDWDSNGNDVFGDMDDENLDLYPDVFVGRAPAENIAELQTFVNKILTYQGNIHHYSNKGLFLGAYDFGDAGGRTKDFIADTYLPDNFELTKYYERDLNMYRDITLEKINEGIHIINHIDHAGPDVLFTGGGSEQELGLPLPEPGEERNAYMSMEDIDGLTNMLTPSIIWSCGCWPAAFDLDAIAEHWITNPIGGGAAFVGNSRYGLNPETDTMLDPSFFKSLFEKNILNIGQTLADSKIQYIGLARETASMRYAMFELNLLGDPEMRISLDNGVYISYPAWKSILKGNITVGGTSYIENFQSYELSYTPKSAPQNKTVIQISQEPVEDGVLGIWDTTTCADGKYLLNLIARDTDGTTASSTIEVTLNNNGMLPPEFSYIPDKIIGEMEPVSFTVSAVDPEGGAVVLSAEMENGDPLPVGAEFTDHGDGSGTFAWATPVAEAETVFPVKFIATDITGLKESIVVNITLRREARIISPDPAKPLDSYTVRFEWLSGHSVAQYGLALSSPAWPEGIYIEPTTEMSAEIPYIPLNGEPVYVDFWVNMRTPENPDWKIQQELVYDTVLPQPANLISPDPSSTITSSTVTFQWDKGVGVTRYGLLVGTGEGDFDVSNIYQGELTKDLSATVNIPMGVDVIYVRLYSFLGPEFALEYEEQPPDAWQYKEYVFEIDIPNQPPVFVTEPTNKTVVLGQTVEFTIEASDVDGDRIYFGGSAIPIGATYQDNGNGTALFRWKPTKTGSYYMVFTIYDKFHDYTQMNTKGITITVTAPRCGDYVLSAGEQCDGTNFGGKTCDDYGYYGSYGALSCTPNCTIDSTGCAEPEPSYGEYYGGY